MLIHEYVFVLIMNGFDEDNFSIYMGLSPPFWSLWRDDPLRSQEMRRLEREPGDTVIPPSLCLWLRGSKGWMQSHTHLVLDYASEPSHKLVDLVCLQAESQVMCYLFDCGCVYQEKPRSSQEGTICFCWHRQPEVVQVREGAEGGPNWRSLCQAMYATSCHCIPSGKLT